ncbi:MAG TPA: hypothetical protein VIV40_39565 [Kofleriaceae bacterium]
MRLGLLVIAACGSKQPAPTVVANRAPPPPPPVAASCGDAGVILRGQVSSGDEAGRAREQLIEQACREGKWSKAVIDCVAGTPHPQDCLDKLSEQQTAAYAERLQAWDEKYGDQADASYNMQLKAVDCATLLADVAPFPPIIDSKAAEREWQTTARAGLLGEACDHDWSETLKECLEDAAGQSAQIGACLVRELGPDEADALTKQLDDVAARAAKIAAAKKKPTTITCSKTVAAHYADATWKQKLDGYKPAERKKMIAASRDLMAKACTTDSWSDTIRACVVSGGSDDCFAGTDKRRWGYPATGAVTSVGIAECDDYSAEVLKFAACTSVPQSARDSIVHSQQQMLAEIARVPAADRAKMASSCKAGMEAIATSLNSAGC